MPYKSINDPTLPSYIINKSGDMKRKWLDIFNTVYDKYGDSMAFVVANKWLTRQLESTTLEAKTMNTIEREEFKLSEGQLIKCTDDGDEYIDFVLTATTPDNKGDVYPEALLKKWESLINGGEVFIGDTDHLEYDRIAEAVASPEKAAELIKNTKKGIAKTFKALFDQGKLWVRAMIDKRYKKQIEKSNGVSLEALIERDSKGTITDGDLLGFTFAVGQQPVHPMARIVK